MSDDAADAGTSTPAAHVETRALCHEVRLETDTIQDLVRVSILSDQIRGSLFLEPHEARDLATTLEDLAATAADHPVAPDGSGGDTDTDEGSEEV